MFTISTAIFLALQNCLDTLASALHLNASPKGDLSILRA